MAHGVFEDVTIRGKKLAAVQPADPYKPLFAVILDEKRRGDWIRTSDPLHPMQVRYQAAPHPDPRVG